MPASRLHFRFLRLDLPEIRPKLSPNFRTKSWRKNLARCFWVYQCYRARQQGSLIP